MASGAVRYCVMQPYFFPYGGYYRLMLETDVFVLFDCAQFPRRGRVHRCEVPDPNGRPTWLTLPIARAPRTALISEIEFTTDAPQEISDRIRRSPAVGRTIREDPRLEPLLLAAEGKVLPYLTRQLEYVAGQLPSQVTLVNASDVLPRDSAPYHDYIVALGVALGATEYTNPPGGRDLYQAGPFLAAGLTLNFLPPYGGPSESVLAEALRSRDGLHSLVTRGRIA